MFITSNFHYFFDVSFNFINQLQLYLSIEKCNKNYERSVFYFQIIQRNIQWQFVENNILTNTLVYSINKS